MTSSNDYYNILETQLIPYLKNKYEIAIYSPNVDERIEHITFKAHCTSKGEFIPLLKLSFYYGDFEELNNIPGKYNFLTYITYLDGEDNGGSEENIGVINLDNNENIEKAVNSVISGLTKLGFPPDVKQKIENQQLGKVLVHGLTKHYIEAKKIDIYENDTLIGFVEENMYWEYQISNDTLLTFKFGPFKTNVKVRHDLNNEIFLDYNSVLSARINYLTTDFDLIKYEQDLKNKEFLNWSKSQYAKVQLRKIIYIIIIILSLFYFKGTLSEILFWFSIIAFIIHLTRYNTNWKHIGGPRYLCIDQVYETQIMLKLIPRLNNALNEYGISILNNAKSKSPGDLTYIGQDREKNSIKFIFYNRHEEMKNENHYKYPMLLKYSYKEVINQTIGEIDLSNKKNVNNTVNLIIATLKNNNLIK